MEDIKRLLGERCALSLIDLIEFLEDSVALDLSKLDLNELDMLRIRIDSIIRKLKEIEVKENED